MTKMHKKAFDAPFYFPFLDAFRQNLDLNASSTSIAGLPFLFSKYWHV